MLVVMHVVSLPWCTTYGACFGWRLLMTVVGYKVLKRELLAGILLDAAHNALTTDGAVIRYIVVHTAVLL